MKSIADLSLADKQKLLSHLKTRVTERRRSLIETNLNARTRFLMPVLEDVYQERNAGALIRTCDCLGIQRMQVIEKEHSFKVSRSISKGAKKWVDYDVFTSTKSCIEQLKSEGFRVVATSPSDASFTPDTLPLDKPMAIFFGTEKDGLSKEALDLADARVHIPMTGFTESFNVSVSAGILFYTLLERLKKAEIDISLSEEERLEVELRWYFNSVKKAEAVLQSLLR